MGWLARFFGGLVERILAVVLALSLAQFPLYYSAYSNTVAGARLEAESRYRELEREAAQLQLTAEAFIVHHETNADPAFQASGRMHRTTLEHFRRYSAMEQALLTAPPWGKPLVLARNFDRSLQAATQFTPGLPLNFEGAVYALAGLLLAWLFTAVARLTLPRAPVRRLA